MCGLIMTSEGCGSAGESFTEAMAAMYVRIIGAYRAVNSCRPVSVSKDQSASWLITTISTAPSASRSSKSMSGE